MELLNDIYVISLTHWDREWRFPFQKTRMLLVEMMDLLLDVLEKDPDYKCFHLDGQTILLEDYCAVRPENADKIKKLVENGRLFIGPWYVLPEENQMSGESLVRNLLWGERIGSKYGGCTKTGYTPTSWGQISQMPQIYNGAGVDNIIFYRGISSDVVKENYYIWKGPDNSTLFGIRLGDHARVAFFHAVDRRVAHNRGPEFTEHIWNAGGKPFRLCGSGSTTPYHFADPPMGWYPERLEEAFESLDKQELGKWKTPFALGFDGDDSTGPFLLTPRIIKEANKLITNGKKIVQTDMMSAMREAQEYLKDVDLEVVQGEMRCPQRAGLFTDLYSEIQATRIPMKYMNRRAEFNLQRIAEPMATLAWTLGREYPRFALDQANQFVLQNHAHDSIGGCGLDEINDEVMFRFRQADILSRCVTEDAAREIAGRIDTSAFSTENRVLIMFNTLPRKRTQIVAAEIDIAKNLNCKGFKIIDTNGDDVTVQVRKKSDFLAVFNHPQELPLRSDGHRWEFLFEAKDVPAMGYRVFQVLLSQQEMAESESMLKADNIIENEFLTVTINSNGTADIYAKETGISLQNQNHFQDLGEVGDYWVGARPEQDKVISTLHSRAGISVRENGPLSCEIEAKVVMELPVGAKKDRSARELKTRSVNITTVYRLVRGEPFLRVSTTIENTVKDHVLRALFPTGIKTDIACAEVAFDVVERAIPLPDTRGWREPYRPTQPHQNFVDLSDKKRGVAILNRGLPQYEAVDDSDRTIALTLLRAHKAWNSVRLAEYPDQSGTQLQGTYTFEYAVLPHKGDWQTGNVMHTAESFNIPVITGAAGAGKGTLPLEQSFLEIENGGGVVMNAFKQCEWDNTAIVRLSNPTINDIDISLNVRLPVRKAELFNLLEKDFEKELPVSHGRISVNIPKKKILTIKLHLETSQRVLKETG